MELSSWRVLGAAVVLLLAYWWRKWSYWSSRGLPSIPAFRVFISNLSSMLVFRNKSIWKLVDEVYHKYGGSHYVGTYEFLKPQLMVGEPSLVKRIMIQDFDSFTDRIIMDFSDKDKYVREMLTNASGSHWKRIRSVMSPTFTSGKMRRMYPLVVAKADNLMKRFSRLHHTAPHVEMKASFSNYVMDVIATCAFGLECNTIDNENEEFSRQAAELSKTNARQVFRAIAILTLPRWLTSALGLSFTTPSIEFFRDVVVETIKLREGQAPRGDFLDLMLEQRAQQTSQDTTTPKYPLDDVTIIAQAIIFLLVGHETTGNMLTFTAFHLAKHPHLQHGLRQEVRSLLQDDGSLPYQDIMAAPFLDACLSETLRLHPPVVLTMRECTKDYILPGTNVALWKGQHVTLPIWSLQNDPRYWSSPEEFRPDRFMPENKPNIVSGTYLPFGLGPRNCIGMRFALMEAKVVLAKTVLQFEMSPAPGHEELQLSLWSMTSKEDIKLVLTPITEVD